MIPLFSFFYDSFMFSLLCADGSISPEVVLATPLMKIMPDMNKRISFMVTVSRRFNFIVTPSLFDACYNMNYNSKLLHLKPL